MNLVLFGPQGSGKGTQAIALSRNFGLRVFATGDVLREFTKTHPDPRLERELASGALLPDEFIFTLLEDYFIHNGAEGIVFDGFPRDQRQYDDFLYLLKKYNGSIPIALSITLGEDESVKRLRARRVCVDCKRPAKPVDGKLEERCIHCGGRLEARHDDTEEAIRKRLKIFRDQTMPVIELYRRQGRLLEVDGTPPIEEVTRAGVRVLSDYIDKQ